MLADATNNGFITVASLATLAGATSACLAVAAVFGDFLGPTMRKLAAFAAAMAISLGVLIVSDGTKGAEQWLVAILNGFLIYATAFGLNKANVAGGGL
ncbi:MAG: hypothetical protein ACJ768_04710 [Gaiellaceae bacterium]